MWRGSEGGEGRRRGEGMEGNMNVYSKGSGPSSLNGRSVEEVVVSSFFIETPYFSFNSPLCPLKWEEVCIHESFDHCWPLSGSGHRKTVDSWRVRKKGPLSQNNTQKRSDLLNKINESSTDGKNSKEFDFWNLISFLRMSLTHCRLTTLVLMELESGSLFLKIIPT